MPNYEGQNLLNLFIDESGASAIYEPRYRCFLISAILLTPSEKELANLLFKKWRDKYLASPNKCFHATDFFEGYVRGYRQTQLRIGRNFNNSIEELIEIISYLTIKGEVYFVDIPELRGKLLLKEPPQYQNTFTSSSDEKAYNLSVDTYKKEVRNTIGRRKVYLPLALTLKSAFDFHFNHINDTQDNYPHKGYIHFESLSGADRLLIEHYYRLRDKVDDSYQEKIIGINFHTKNSLDAGIELADLISYISFQTLRFKYRRTEEYSNLTLESIVQIRKLRTFIREKLKIKLIEVTNNVL